jgi:TPR repeat protein
MTHRYGLLAVIQRKANQGDASAEYQLGVMYEEGQDLPKDTTEALKWYRKAAEQGNATAQTNLGAAYANGQGVPQDDAGSGKMVSQGG